MKINWYDTEEATIVNNQGAFDWIDTPIRHGGHCYAIGYHYSNSLGQILDLYENEIVYNPGANTGIVGAIYYNSSFYFVLRDASVLTLTLCTFDFATETVSTISSPISYTTYHGDKVAVDWENGDIYWTYSDVNTLYLRKYDIGTTTESQIATLGSVTALYSTGVDINGHVHVGVSAPTAWKKWNGGAWDTVDGALAVAPYVGYHGFCMLGGDIYNLDKSKKWTIDAGTLHNYQIYDGESYPYKALAVRNDVWWKLVELNEDQTVTVRKTDSTGTKYQWNYHNVMRHNVLSDIWFIPGEASYSFNFFEEQPKRRNLF